MTDEAITRESIEAMLWTQRHHEGYVFMPRDEPAIKRQADVLVRRYSGQTVESFASIARSYGVHRNVVRILDRKGLVRLKNLFRRCAPPDGLPDTLLEHVRTVW